MVEKVEADPELNWGALSTAVSYGALESALVSVLPVLALREFHVRAEWCLIVLILTAAVSSLIWGNRSDRWGPRAVATVLVGLLVLLPMLLLLLIPTLSPAALGWSACVVFGILAGGLYPVGFSWLLVGLPEAHYGYASGAQARAYGLGSLVGPVSVGLVVERFHAAGLFGAVCLVGLLNFGYLKLRTLRAG
jgi:MFS family permease